MKTFVPLILVSLQFLSYLSIAQTFDWVQRFGSGQFESGTSIVSDADGNIYSVGIFNASIDLDPGSGDFTLSCDGNFDSYISKLDSTGSFVWAGKIGGIGDIRALSMTVDDSGYIYLAGAFSETADFDPGVNTSNLTASHDYDLFLCKLESDGSFLWARQFGGVSWFDPMDVTTDNMGNVYIVGDFSFTSDFDPGTGTQILTPSFSDGFLLKLNHAGEFDWVKQFQGILWSLSVTLDNLDNILIAGSFDATVDFDPGNGVFELTTSSDRDAFVVKLNENGDFIWANRWGGFGTDNAQDISTDLSGNIYTTGYFHSTVDFDPGIDSLFFYNPDGLDGFVSKLDSNGTFQWAKQFSASMYMSGESIIADSTGSVLISGYFSDTTDFDPNLGTVNIATNGSTDGFILNLDSSGNLNWVHQIGDAQIDNINSINIDPYSNILVTGEYMLSPDFDFASTVVTVPSLGQSDAFVLKLSRDSQPVSAPNVLGNGIKAFPNPTKDVVRLDFGAAIPEANITIYDSIGKALYSNRLLGKNHCDLTLPKVSGIYFIQLSDTDGSTRTLKVVKE